MKIGEVEVCSFRKST